MTKRKSDLGFGEFIYDDRAQGLRVALEDNRTENRIVEPFIRIIKSPKYNNLIKSTTIYVEGCIKQIVYCNENNEVVYATKYIDGIFDKEYPIIGKYKVIENWKPFNYERGTKMIDLIK